VKNLYGTIGFVALGLLTFRLAYGAWPPFEGEFGQWLAPDSRAGWSMVAAVVGGIVGALLGRAMVRE
jgi:hypothetical protein